MIAVAAAAATDALLLTASQLSSLRASDELADVDQALTRFLTTLPSPGHAVTFAQQVVQSIRDHLDGVPTTATFNIR